MDKAIEYVLLKMEETYYEKNPDIRIMRTSCLRDEGLTCNCITGIAINYVGYLLFICCNIVNCSISFELSSAMGYIQVLYKGKPLMLPLLNTPNISECYLYEKICVKEKEKRQQTRIAFRQHLSMEDLNKSVRNAEEIMQEINEEKGIDYCHRLKFWIPFLKALRVQPLEKSSRAFLAMAIFMFPGKTLQYVYKTVKMASDDKSTELRWVTDFLSRYNAFLEGLEDINAIFSFYEFSRKFKELTTLEIGYFIEDIIHNSKVPSAQDTLYEIFSTALSNNLREKNKRGMLYKIIAFLNKRGYEQHI